jgi:predicted TIM-barrel fold metal-dependent hydrolase
MIIDFHVHVNAGDRKCITNLLKADDKFGIDKSVIFCPDNAFTMKAAKAHKDRLVPFGWVGWGAEDPKKIDELAAEGFRGIKVIYPAFPYNDPRLDPYYSKAQEHGLPLLMHTGIVSRSNPDVPNWMVDTSRMKVILLDAPCRKFPKLTIVAAHLGNPDHEEGGMMARWHPNFYFDLSGSSLLHRSHEFFRTLFWWEKETRFSKRNSWKPFEKMLFATDEPYEIKGEPMREQRELLEALGQSKETIAKVFGGTAARILKLKK